MECLAPISRSLYLSWSLLLDYFALLSVSLALVTLGMWTIALRRYSIKLTRKLMLEKLDGSSCMIIVPNVLKLLDTLKED